MIARRGGAVSLGCVLLTLAGAPAGAQQLPGDTLSFRSHGATLQARYYRSRQPGRHPTALLIHGFPGVGTDMLGLGVALSDGGWNALFYHPRGFDGSEGEYTLEAGLEDAATALAFLREGAGRLNVDTARLAVVGYSHGGWAALMTGMRGAPVACVAAVAPDNLGLDARRLQADSAYAAGLRQTLANAAQRGLVRLADFDATRATLRAHADEYDTMQHGAALAGKSVLVVGGWRDLAVTLDLYVAPLVRALRAGGARVTPLALDDDHSFRSTRPELQRAVLEWLGRECVGSARPPETGPT